MPDLDVLLREGAVVSSYGKTARIRRTPSGLLNLLSGQVAAADPGTLRGDDPPFAVRVPPGRYPVVLIELCPPESERVMYTAGLQLVIRDEPVVRWEPARFDDGDPGAPTAADGIVCGFAVDCGVAALMDALAIPVVAALEEGARTDIALSANVLVGLDPRTGLNLFVCDSGGDGFYGVWVGRTAEGAVATFITEFQAIDPEEQNEQAAS
jgi:hypothetical protein